MFADLPCIVLSFLLGAHIPWTRGFFGLKIITPFACGIIGSPVDGFLDFLQQWNVLRTVDVGFLDLHHDPPFRLPSAHDGNVLADFFREVWPAHQQGIILQELRAAVDMEAHGALKKIDKEHADMGVLGDIPETRQDAVPSVFRIEHRLGIEDPYKPRQTRPEGAVTRATGIGRRNENQLLLRNEGAHRGVEMVKHLVLVKCRGTALRPEAFLECMFTV